MKFFVLFVFFSLFINCSSTANDEETKAQRSGASEQNNDNTLESYRETALRYLVLERVKKDIHSITFEKKGFFAGWHLTIFQGDNVDRSVAVFHISHTNEKMKCGLYIREKTQTDLAVNLLECEGPYAQELSGSKEYGLRLLTVSKKELQEL